MGKEIESLPTESLIPYARNARTHSDAQVAQIAASIREFGFNNPVLIDSDGGIIAGHGRIMAARKLGLEAVPCLRLSHLSENDKRAYILADNKLAENSGWDESMLALELSALQSEDFDLGLIGFDPDELARLLDGEGVTDEKAPVEHGINYEEHYSVLVECSGEQHQAEVFESLKASGYTCKVLVN